MKAIILLPFALLLGAGCTDAGAFEGEFGDADFRTADSLSSDGAQKGRSRTIEVPAGVERLVLKLAVKGDAKGLINLERPDGVDRAELELDGTPIDLHSDAWLVVDHPDAGAWGLSIGITSGRLDYAVGAYW